MTHSPRPSPARGFTLIELLVVIAIVAIVAGLVIAAAAGAFATGNEKRTGVMLATLQNSVTEYESQTGVGFPGSGYAYPGSNNANHPNYERSIDDYIEAVHEVAQARELFEIVSPRFRKDQVDDDNDSATGMSGNADNNDELADSVIDAWDRPVRYVPSLGDGAAAGDLILYRDAGLTIRKTAYFASAGVDGLWGRVNDDNTPATTGAGWDMNNDNIPDAQDNLYSYEVE